MKKFVILGLVLLLQEGFCATTTIRATKIARPENNGTYTFNIFYENISSNETATNVTIIDAIPIWFEYIKGSAGTETQPATITYSYDGGKDYFDTEGTLTTNIKWQLKNNLNPGGCGTATFKAIFRKFK